MRGEWNIREWRSILKGVLGGRYVPASRRCCVPGSHLYLIFYILYFLCTSPFLTSCKEEEDMRGEEQERTLTLEVGASAPAYEEVSDLQRSNARRGVKGWSTRGGESPTYTWEPPTSYYLYSDGHVSGFFVGQNDPVSGSIDAFFTEKDKTEPSYHGRLRKSSDGTWKLVLNPADVPPGVTDLEFDPTTYYIYGYVPRNAADRAEIARLDESSTFDKGSVLTLRGLKPVAASDICVTIGAREGFRKGTVDYDGGFEDKAGGTTGVYDEGTDSRINRLRAGYFGFKAKGGEGAENYLFLLFDHLYSSVRFNFKVDATYNNLRTIVLKKLELKAVGIKEKYDETITLTANETGDSPITSLSPFVEDPTSDEPSYITLFDGNTLDKGEYPLRGFTLSPSSYSSSMGGYVMPGNRLDFLLRATYDIYDKNPSEGHPEGNLVRQNCTAENQLNFGTLFRTAELTRGQRYALHITVNPTYLYVLSEPDLDSPRMVVE